MYNLFREKKSYSNCWNDNRIHAVLTFFIHSLSLIMINEFGDPAMIQRKIMAIHLSMLFLILYEPADFNPSQFVIVSGVVSCLI